MLERRAAPNRVVYYASPLLESLGVPHGFSTRVGGVSPPPFDALNLGNPVGCAAPDPDEPVEANYRLLEAAAGFRDGHHRRCWVRQVHGGDVRPVATVDAFENGQPADALVTADARAALSIRVADCVPVLIASGDGAVVAAVHAGWRGVIAGAVPNAVRAMRGLRADAYTRDGVAAIGPCIGPDAFEVGPDVADEFRRAFPHDPPARERPGGKWSVDLRAAIVQQLVAAGIDVRHIDSTDRCTVRDRDEFFSHRRDNGLTGRMAAVIAPRG